MQTASEWAQTNFGTCDLGDKRRTRRIVKVAEEIAAKPAAGLAYQFEHWGDLKAAYRLFDSERVTFEAVARPHWELTKQRAQGRTLIINDTTELDFDGRRDIEGLGPVGNGTMRHRRSPPARCSRRFLVGDRRARPAPGDDSGIAGTLSGRTTSPSLCDRADRIE